MDRPTIIALVSGIIILAAGVALAVFSISEQATSVLVGWAFALLIFAFVRINLSRKGEVYKDERTWKIQSTSMTMSWVVTFAALAGTYMLSSSDLLSLSPEHLVLVLMLVMTLSFMAGVTYFSRRGI